MSDNHRQLPKITNFPSELLTEVLSRLPVKTLLKIRCVCKTWCSLIDSSDFISMHHDNAIINNNSENSQILIAFQRRRLGYNLIAHRIDTCNRITIFGTFSNSYRIVNSCNGLILVEYDNNNNTNNNNLFDKMRMLWNPSIRKSIILPKCPLESAAIHILGFAPSSNDYKVLTYELSTSCIAVYSLNDDTWRPKTSQVSVDGSPWLGEYGKREVVYSGGVLYWVSCDQYNHPVKADQGTCMIYFDFDVEEFGVLQLPNVVEQSMVWLIFPFRDSIAIFTMCSDRRCIWVMEKDGGKDPWKLWLFVSGEPDLDACMLLKPTYSHIGCWVSDLLYAVEYSTLLIGDPKRWNPRRLKVRIVKSYNIANQEVQCVGDFIDSTISFLPYVESLVLHRVFEGQNLIFFP